MTRRQPEQQQPHFAAYGAPPPSHPGQQQHHPGQAQPAMAHAQQPQASAPPQQQQQPTPNPAPAPTPRQRKRPAPSQQQAPAAAAPPPVNQTPIQPPQQGAPAPPAGAPVPAAPAPTDDSTPQPPPAKKSRTNTPWTPAEELRLKQMRDAGNSWAEIARTFPTRTEGSVKKHWYKDMHYAEFAEDESQALLNAIKEYENNKWKTIGQKVGKPAKACEQYAKEKFPELFSTPKAR
ncbi:hypothetical protein GE09DRAFT_1264204 [Coniochaeta sp. 2T2.1]|nr:hypothetical protein GE09DRAFT_1264204 [Coniochaeta sp. 2T2.1]